MPPITSLSNKRDEQCNLPHMISVTVVATEFRFISVSRTHPTYFFPGTEILLFENFIRSCKFSPAVTTVVKFLFPTEFTS